VTAQTPKIKSNWWYLLPIFLGVIGGIIAWVALKSHDGKLAKNSLILGIILNVIGMIIFTGIVISSDNFNLVTEFENISESKDFEFQFKINSP
jgi:hypothetical protein